LGSDRDTTQVPGSPLRDALGDWLLPLVALTAYAACFYLRWPVWEDQATYQYMAWGLLHGMRPYVDLVDVNFPGIIPIHILAQLISGADPLGLRLLDLLFTLGLCFGTSWLLTSWGVTRPLRLLALTAYLVGYFATGHFWTAQRDSFALPLLVAGFMPFMAPRGHRAPLAWLPAGVAVGLGLWIKPTLTPAYLWLSAMWLLVGPRPIGVRWRSWALHALGLALVSVGFLLWLTAWGSLQGFVHWCIHYAFGAYHHSGWPWLIRFSQTARRLWANGAPGPVTLLAIGIVAGSRREVRGPLWDRYRYELTTVIGLCAVLLFVVLCQGKGHSVYQYIPFQWSLTMLGALLASARDWRRANTLVIAVCLLAFTAVGAKVALRPPSPAVPTDGTRMAQRVAPLLRPGETIVTFGFANTLLSALERPTPFPVISSWILYAATPPTHPGRKEPVRVIRPAPLTWCLGCP